MRKGQPNLFPCSSTGWASTSSPIFFEITLMAEGTVRGTGSVRVADYDCSTDVPRLYAADDTATRELICGGFTGGGSHNAAWAASSGSWAGQGAAAFAMRRRRSGAGLRPVGGAGVRPTGAVSLGHRDVIAEVQRRVLPYDPNYLRNGDLLTPALKSLHDMWSEVRGAFADGEDLFRAREAAAMVAHGRWMYHAALARTETRGMHEWLDYPMQNRSQGHRLLSGGLDDIWSHPEPVRVAA